MDEASLLSNFLSRDKCKFCVSFCIFHTLQRPIDGILGLGFSWLSSDYHAPPFQYAAERGLVDPVFTVYMEHAGGSKLCINIR